MSVTVRFQSSGTIPGDGRPVTMRGQALTIGRGPENDLVLPDPHKVVSKRHCVLEDQGGSIMVVDLSTNGTFLNYGKLPLGPTPAPLSHGDVLGIGDYELVVEIAATPAARAGTGGPGPLAPAPSPLPAVPSRSAPPPRPGDGDFLDDILGTPSRPAGHGSVARPGPGADAGDGLLPPLDLDDLLGPGPRASAPAMPAHDPGHADGFRPPRAAAPLIPDDWDDLLAPGPEPEALPPPPDDNPFRETGTTAPPGPRPSAPPPASPAPGSDLPALLAAAGLGHLSIPPDQAPAVAERIGRVFRSFVEGVRELLMSRTALKSEFRIETTTIAATGNNPLKFSLTPEQATEAMLNPPRGALPAEQAVAEALADIKAHEIATVTGMEAALRGLLDQLSPAALERRITEEGGGGGFLKGRKARYWEAYETLYGTIAEQAETDFRDLFAREFARAYQAQLDRLRAGDTKGKT